MVGVPHAIALNSCTAALHLALLAAGIGPGDEVITTPLTFCATANVIVHTGAEPRFADIDAATWNLTPASAASALTPATRAVVPVHYAGRAADVSGFRALATRAGIALIEDAAHAVESVSAGAKIGTTGDATCFSFYATKNLTTGEGGMLTTASDDWAAFARVASLHGLSRDAWARYSAGASAQYDVTMPGYKYNMMRGPAGRARPAPARRHRTRVCGTATPSGGCDEGLADLHHWPAGVSDGDVHGGISTRSW